MTPLGFVVAAALVTCTGCKCSRTENSPSPVKSQSTSLAASSAPVTIPKATCLAARTTGDRGDAVLAALFAGWDPSSRRAPVTDGHVTDCLGRTAPVDWSGARGDPPPAGHARVRGKRAVDPAHGFYLVATSIARGDCEGEKGFIVYASFTVEEARVEASAPWSVGCAMMESEVGVEPRELASGTVWVEDSGLQRPPAGLLQGMRAWVLNPPSLVPRDFVWAKTTRCDADQKRTCREEHGELTVVDGALRYRHLDVVRACVTPPGGVPCRPEHASDESTWFRIADGELREDAALAAREKTATHAADFYALYAGTVAGAAVTGTLLREGDFVSGAYGYVKKDVPDGVPYRITLAGWADGNHVTLSERVAAGDETTGHFDGTLGDDGAFRGTWTSGDGKRSVPFDWQRKSLFGRPGGLATVAANVVLVDSTPYNDVDPVGTSRYTSTLVLLDRRKGFVVRALDPRNALIVHGACDAGEALGANDAEVPALRAAFEKAHPGDHILQADVLTAGCERAYGYLKGVVVVDRPGVGIRVVAHWWLTTQEPLDLSASPPTIDVDL